MAELVAGAEAIAGVIATFYELPAYDRKNSLKILPVPFCMNSSSVLQDYLQSLRTTYEQWWEENAFIDEIKDAWFEFVLDGKTKSDEPANDQKQAGEQRQEITQPVLSLIEDYRHQKILIVGSPGAGKTTLLKRLLRDATEKAQKDEQSPIPVLIELKDYETTGNRTGVQALILESLKSHDPALDEEALKQLLTGKRLLLLADGLNELSHEPAKTELKNLCRHQAVIATSRFANDWWNIDRKLEIQPLTPQQVKRFWEERLPNRDHAEVEKLGERVRDVGQTPLMVWMLYTIFQAGKETPTTRGEAYRTFTALYIERAKTGLDLAESRFLLSKLAFEMMQSQKSDDPTHFSLDMTEVDAQNRLGSAKTLNQLLSLHLLQASGQPGNRKIRFCHQTLQEYYAAEALLEQLQKHPEWLEKTPEQQWTQFQQDYLNYVKWTEAIALMLGLPEVPDNQAKHLVELTLDIDLILGARLVGEVKQQFQAQTIEVLNQLLVQQNLPVWLKVELLGETRSNLAISYLFQFLSHPNIEIVQRAASFIEETTNQTAIALLTQGLEEIDSKFFAQTSFGGADPTGDLWTTHIKALAHLAPQAAIQFLRNRLLNADGRKKGIIHAVTQAPQLLMQLDGESILPKLIEELYNLQTEDQDWIHLFERQLKEQSENQNYIDLLGWELTPKRIEQIIESSIKSKKSQILNLVEYASNCESIVPSLIKALEQEKDTSIQARIIQIIGRSNHELTNQTLVKLLSHENFKIRKESGIQLIKRKIDELDGIEKLLDHENWDIAWSAAVVLGSLGYTVAFPILAEAFQKREFKYLETRCTTAKVLSSLSEDISVPLLLDILSSDLNDEAEVFLRREAAFSLSQFGREEAIPELKLTLGVGYRDGYSNGIRGLARLNVEEPLREILITKAPGWQTAAVELGKLGRSDVLPELCQALVDLGGESANEVIHLLSEFADLDTIDWLLVALEHPEQHTADPYFPNRIALVLVECHPEILKNRLSSLMDITNRKYIQQLFWVIPAIQSHCGFYNYEIYQYAQDENKLESSGDFISQFYKDIDQVIYQIEKNPELRQQDGEDRSTIEIVGSLRSSGYSANHDCKIGGHVDLTVEKDNLVWLGEAKIYKDNNYLWEGFLQLTTRYSTGDTNQNSGGLLIYIFDEDAKSIMEKWQDYLLSKSLPCYTYKPCKMRSLAFISSHRHERSGDLFHVRHMPVLLHFVPKDKSGRRRKNKL